MESLAREPGMDGGGLNEFRTIVATAAKTNEIAVLVASSGVLRDLKTTAAAGGESQSVFIWGNYQSRDATRRAAALVVE